MTIKGNLKDMNLPSIVTLNCNEGNQAFLRIISGKREAVVYFDSGRIAHAALDSQEGEEVIYELLTWDKGTFELEQNVPPPKRTITTPWSSLLLEGMRRIDEGAANGDGLDKKMEFEAKEKMVASRGSPPMNAKKKAHIKEKEVMKMDVEKLKQAMDVLKKNMGDGVLASDIYSTSDGQPLVSFDNNNPQPVADALFNKITQMIDHDLNEAGFPPLGRYYLMELVDGKMALLIYMGDYQWGMLVDSTKTQLGLLLNVVLPKIIDAFEEAIAE